MTIKVLEPGCMNCKTLERRTLQALEELKLTAQVDKVEDLDRIVSYGILRTPGLVIDEKVVFQGGVPPVSKIKKLIVKAKEGTLTQ